MKIAFVGSGYVFDIYMRTAWAYSELEIVGIFDIDRRRMDTVAQHYNLATFESLDALLADERVDVVINLTSIRSHYEVTKRSLLAGKHVYSEKPVTLNLAQSRELFALAEQQGRVLTGAPSNLFSDSIATIWKAIQQRAIGKPVLIYAELDDNPAHLMHLDEVESPTGAPFPYAEELQEGCTVEHVAYHLTWICAMFGPALAVTAFSQTLVENKTQTPLFPADTPDFSVACLTFAGGVAARITCSWVAPRDHSFKVIGEEGALTADNVFHDQTEVRLERFSRSSLAARKLKIVRDQPPLGRLFGIGGRKLKQVRRWKSYAVESEPAAGRSLKQRLVGWLRRKQVYSQDKMLGVAEMIRAISADQPQSMTADFLLHINELTLLIQRAGEEGVALRPQTTFSPLQVIDWEDDGSDYRVSYRPQLLENLLNSFTDVAHRR